MYYSDVDIEREIRNGEIGINGPDGTPAEDIWERLQPASLDLTLGNKFLRPRNGSPTGHTSIDFKHDTSDLLAPVHVEDGDPFLLGPGQYALGSTAETIRIPNDVVANVAGKSSLARLGLAIHITAGLCDPGFEGDVTLELFNHSPWVMKLWPSMRCAQISFARLETPSMAGYVGKYTGQSGPTASRYHLNWSDETGEWL